MKTPDAIFPRSILAKESLYGDGPPTWPDAPFSKAAVRDRRRLITRLCRFKTLVGAGALAHRIDGCRPGRRCASGACPECLRAFQRWWVDRLPRLEVRNQLVAVSVALPTWRAAQSDLKFLDLSAILADFTEVVRNNVRWALFGLDVSLNDDRQKGLGVAFQLQLYGFADVDDRATFANDLRSKYASSDVVKRPSLVKLSDGTPTAFSYGFKTDFVRRVAYRGAGRTRTGGVRKCWRTNKVSLRAPDEVELRLWLDEIGLHGRVFSYVNKRTSAFNTHGNAMPNVGL